MNMQKIIGDNNYVFEKRMSRFVSQDKDYEINNYEQKFIVNEIEVFQVL